jgi:hypothetical protein
MAGRYPLDRARLYDELEDALAALDVARDAVHAALDAASYPHLRSPEKDRVTEENEAASMGVGAA